MRMRDQVATEKETQVTEAKPFLRWVGGKRQLLPELRKELPAKFETYYEPFVGGGTLFFDLRANGFKGNAVLGDANDRLIRSYRGIKTHVEDVVDNLRRARVKPEVFYAEREALGFDNWVDSRVASWFIYLNKCCFNGLWRVNKSGKFNVPFGKWKTPPTICDDSNLHACARALRNTKLVVGPFERTVFSAKCGDLVYFDPPYMPVSATANFTSYTKDGFGWQEQESLARCAVALRKEGVHVILSHPDVPPIRVLYQHLKFKIRRVEARRAVNSDASKRGPVGELIITG